MASRRSALIVDDSPAVRAMIRAALADVGLDVREAQDGAEAWRVLADARFELIVSDIHMPFVDGLKLIGLVRSGGAHRLTPIVVVTADGTQDDCRRALELGANVILKKPLDPSALGAAVTNLLP
jgi:two-component system, chemotaxis family, chemotaxis protein CheY